MRFQGGTLFPLVVAVVLVVGLALIVYARASQPAADASAPQPGIDHWHGAYGFQICTDTPQIMLTGNLEDKDAAGEYVYPDFVTTGVHSHDDGVIHWHAYTSASVGKRATLGVFLANYGVELTDESLKFPENQNDGKEYVEGETKCADDKDGELSVTVWDSPEDTSNGQRYISGFDDIHIDHDGMVFTIAFTPRGTTVTQPPWAANLAELGAVDSGQVAPTTTLPGGSTPSTVATTGTGETATSEVIGATGATASTATTVAPAPAAVPTTTTGG